MKSPLSDLKVLEIASVLAGPAVGMYFAEKGAKVTKVENKSTKGDVTRSWKLPTEDKDSSISAYFCSVNWHKEYLMLDLKDESQRPQLENLIKQADILVTNFKFGDAKKFNLDFATVAAINPQIIHAELSGFGAHNPRVAYDIVLQAETGFMFMNGNPGERPPKLPLAFIDVLAAHQLKEGILEALLMRTRIDKAFHVEVSLYDAAIASLANQASNYLMTGLIPQPIGSLHPNISPYGEVCETKDGQKIVFAVGSNKQFNALFEILGLEVNEKFESNKDRVTHRTEIERILQSKVIEWNAEELSSILIERNVPNGIIKNMEQVFQNPDAQQLILEEEIDSQNTKRVKTAVYSITST